MELEYDPFLLGILRPIFRGKFFLAVIVSFCKKYPFKIFHIDYQPGTPKNHLSGRIIATSHDHFLCKDFCLVPTISYVKIWNHPIETTIYKLMLRFPGAYMSLCLVDFTTVFESNLPRLPRIQKTHVTTPGAGSSKVALAFCTTTTTEKWGGSTGWRRGFQRWLGGGTLACRSCWFK